MHSYNLLPMARGTSEDHLCLCSQKKGISQSQEMYTLAPMGEMQRNTRHLNIKTIPDYCLHSIPSTTNRWLASHLHTRVPFAYGISSYCGWTVSWSVHRQRLVRGPCQEDNGQGKTVISSAAKPSWMRRVVHRCAPCNQPCTTHPVCRAHCAACGDAVDNLLFECNVCMFYNPNRYFLIQERHLEFHKVKDIK